jgi:UDP-N-acetyl-D-glucosamine/UDP-N-acetyl-D-galactosamine dehydrogenase
VPVLEKFISLKFNEDFYGGYYDKIKNSGEKLHIVVKIKNVTSRFTTK